METLVLATLDGGLTRVEVDVLDGIGQCFRVVNTDGILPLIAVLIIGGSQLDLTAAPGAVASCLFNLPWDGWSLTTGTGG